MKNIKLTAQQRSLKKTMQFTENKYLLLNKHKNNSIKDLPEYGITITKKEKDK